MRRIFLVLLALGLAGCVALDDAGQIEAETAAYAAPIALGEWVWLNKPYLRARPTKICARAQPKLLKTAAARPMHDAFGKVA